MARRRKYGEDLTYAEWHRDTLPQLYGRIGHRQDMADRDWTEFCHWCKQPIAIVEEVIDRGQDLYDKSTAVTEALAKLSGLPAYLVAPRIPRPLEVQRRIDELNKELRKLESEYPISEFRIRCLVPQKGRIYTYDSEEWAYHLLMVHRSHHQYCPAARKSEIPVKKDALRDAKQSSPLWVPVSHRLPGV